MLYDGKFLYEYNYRKKKETGRINFYNKSNYKTAVNAAYSLKYSVISLLLSIILFYFILNGIFYTVQYNIFLLLPYNKKNIFRFILCYVKIGNYIYFEPGHLIC